MPSFAMRESTASFSQSIESVSKAMTDLGAGVCRSIEMLSQALQQPYAVARAPVFRICSIKTQCKLHLRLLRMFMPNYLPHITIKILEVVETFIINHRVMAFSVQTQLEAMEWK